MKNKAGFLPTAFSGFLLALALGFSPVAFPQASDGAPENTKPPLQIVNQTGIKVGDSGELRGHGTQRRQQTDIGRKKSV